MPRPSPSERGYDANWRRNSARFLKAHPCCVDCGELATVSDHAPRSRRELVEAGEPHPDAWQHLQPRCERCHNQRTARTQPAGVVTRAARRRAVERHPGALGEGPLG